MFAVKKLICGEDTMLDLYMVIVLLSCFVLIITAASVITGNVKICAVEKSPKSEIYARSNLFF